MDHWPLLPPPADTITGLSAITQLFKLPQLNQEARLSALAAAAGLYYDGAGDSQSVFPARSHLRVSDIQKLCVPPCCYFLCSPND